MNQAAAMHLDLASWSFDIQEGNQLRQELEVVPGNAALEGGYFYANGRPGLGVDLDNAKATALLAPDGRRGPVFMAEGHMADGTVVRP